MCIIRSEVWKIVLKVEVALICWAQLLREVVRKYGFSVTIPFPWLWGA